MTRRQMRHSSWGAPSDITHSDVAEGRVEIWTYGDNRIVRFDDKGRVTAVQR